MAFKRYFALPMVFATLLYGADPRDAQIADLKKKIESMQDSLGEMEERIDQNELSSTLNKVKFGLEVSTSASNLNFKDKDTAYHNNGKIASEVHLNMAARTERLNFTGRLSIAKSWGDMGWNGLPSELEAGRGFESGPVVYLERAFVDYMILEGLTATIGRQPGTDGPGSNLRNNSARMSTYPALLVNVLGDALVFTYAPKYFDTSALAFRVGYSKIYQGGNSGGNYFTFNQKDNDADLLFVGAEGKLPLGFMGDNLAILSYVQILNHTLPIETGALNLGPVNLGNAQVANAYFENNRFFGLPLNWFIAGGFFKGSAANQDDVVRKITNGAVGGREQLDQIVSSGLGGAEMAQAQAVANALRFNEESAYAVHVGARYDLPFDFKLGYEFFHGSQYWYALSRASINDPLDFRNTRGNVHDIYLIYQLDFYQFLRASYTNIHNKYSNNGLPFGGALPVDRTNEVFMLMYNVKF
ncbi:hypothetical protein CCZ01_06905 [Helicobacter monodelphidis]|uniref:DUF3373 family protein n=1 Tax=Helicobacter sp. 15-1451 TaxID=2004995 RepID=UPI000DCB2DAF|nr:DUF3373 family protein [Helicobacter sp. 15-1451]RAX57187.1 hypothetical protein CCZ01_06905 [Helicobacter sp. 15-1451]